MTDIKAKILRKKITLLRQLLNPYLITQVSGQIFTCAALELEIQQSTYPRGLCVPCIPKSSFQKRVKRLGAKNNLSEQSASQGTPELAGCVPM